MIATSWDSTDYMTTRLYCQSPSKMLRLPFWSILSPIAAVVVLALIIFHLVLGWKVHSLSKDAGDFRSCEK